MLTLAQQLGGMEFVDWTNPVNRAHPLNRGLVSWWLAVPNRMGWGSFTWRDLCRKNNVTLSSNMSASTDWVSALGRRGGFGALDFDGTNDYAIVPNAADQSFSDNDEFTIYASIYPRSAAANADFITSWATVGDNRSFIFRYNTSSLVEGFTSSDGINTASSRPSVLTVTVNTWADVGFVYKASARHDMYVRGIKSNGTLTGSIPATLFPNTNDFQFGSFDTGTTRNFNGLLDNVRFYGRALTDNEMAALTAESSSGYPSLLNRIPLPFPMQQAAAAGVIGRGLVESLALQRLSLVG